MQLPDISVVVPNVVIAVIIVGLVQWLASTGRLSKADAPGASIIAGGVFGVLLGIAGHGFTTQVIYDGIYGLAVGALGTGTYALADKVGGGSASDAFVARRERLAARRR